VEDAVAKLSKKEVAKRYHRSTIHVMRMVRSGTFPPPERLTEKAWPLWDEAALDAFDRKLAADAKAKAEPTA
jgi:predicted DNA-binding transcriptional regulator AlpA